ncbi:MAG: hypothetical protein IPJ11_05555 [Gemmatimonadetes bacterium]|nr:hypothetical protein [Gemmatimonadota bacterium]
MANPLAGGKVTGKYGAWTVAHLTALDEFGAARDGSATADTRSLANLTRLRRDVGDNSVAGITLTNRDEDGHHNRVISADTRIVFNKLYYFQGQLGASFTKDDRSDKFRSDPLWDLEVDRTGRAFGFNYKITAIGNDFETWSGFVNRTGIATARAFNRYSVYGSRGALIEQATVFGGISRIYRYSELGGKALEGGQELNASMRLRGGWNLSSRGELAFVRFDPAAYANYTVDRTTVGLGAVPQPFPLSSGIYDALGASLTISTPTWRLWQGSLRVERGTKAIFPEAAEARGTSATASITMRPSPAVRVFGTLAVQKLERKRDGSEFARTVLPRLKVEVQPNRSLFFRMVGEYRSERQAMLIDPVSGDPILINGSASPARQTDRLRVDWLASYEPTPGTVAFLGYGSTLRGDRPLTFRELERTEDGLFVKVAYLFRR